MKMALLGDISSIMIRSPGASMRKDDKDVRYFQFE